MIKSERNKRGKRREKNIEIQGRSGGERRPGRREESGQTHKTR